ncbi:hypothetical protein JG688_00017407, partial [Phytophthora aleatoria]
MSSILVTDADESATLEATLAFLDAWEAPTTDSSVASPVSTSQTPAQGLTPQQQDQRCRRKKPRCKYPNSSSTVLQRRKKAEILALRSQVEQLEVQLVQLKQVPGAKCTLEGVEDALLIVPGRLPVSWAKQAAVQYRRRLQAEKTNTKLKSIMANQIKVSEALRTLLQKTAMLEDMDFLHPAPCRPLADWMYSMELLEKRVENLYLDADAVFKPERMNSISVEAMVKQNQSLGKTVEIVSTTPMLCPLKMASDTLWNWFSLMKPLRERPNTLERDYTLLLESQIGTLEFRKQNFMRRYEEADRVVVVWADILRLPKYKLQFRNQSWLVITPSADAPKDTSVLRTFQQVFVDYDESLLLEQVDATSSVCNQAKYNLSTTIANEARKHHRQKNCLALCNISYLRLEQLSTPGTVLADYNSVADRLAEDGCNVVSLSYYELLSRWMHEQVTNSHTAVGESLSLRAIRNELKGNAADVIAKPKDDDLFYGHDLCSCSPERYVVDEFVCDVDSEEHNQPVVKKLVERREHVDLAATGVAFD